MSAERRIAALEALLRDLPRLTAPSELDGRVVAALHAGQREDRALRAFGDLGRSAAPGDLAQRVAGELVPDDDAPEQERPSQERIGERITAPEALEAALSGSTPEDAERRLAARLARQIGRLERLEAPRELDERVAAALGQPSAHRIGGPRDQDEHPRRPSRALLAGAGALAAAFAVVLLLRGASLPGSRPSSEPEYVPSFELVRGDDTSSGSPSVLGASFLSGLTGGASFVAEEL